MNEWVGPYPESDRRSDKYIPAEQSLAEHLSSLPRPEPPRELQSGEALCHLCGRVFTSRPHLDEHKRKDHPCLSQSKVTKTPVPPPRPLTRSQSDYAAFRAAWIVAHHNTDSNECIA